MYIEQVQALSDRFATDHGRAPAMFIQTFGCQMNDRESEKLQGLLFAMCYSLSEKEQDADLVLYNTCCVRESAENKVYGKLGYLKAYKSDRPHMVIVFCGCMPQRKEVMEKINRFHRHIDVVFGTFNRHHFPQLLYEHLTSGEQVVEILEEHPIEEAKAGADAGPGAGIYEYGGHTTRSEPHKAGVVIMFGCDNFCSYCIVPYVRGREISRKPEEVLTEIEALIADGVKEVMLLGQNVNSYAYDFPALIKKVNEIDGLRRVRFMTSHPKDLSPELINSIKNCDKLCKHIHLPLQAGSDAILAAMNRGYTKKQYLGLVAQLKKAVEDIAITTDIIVGFPGETDEDFEHTLDAVRKAQFAGAFTFLYSHRDGTPSAKPGFAKEVPTEVAKERFNRLVELLNPMQLVFNERHLNRVVEVMVDTESKGKAPDRKVLNHKGSARGASSSNYKTPDGNAPDHKASDDMTSNGNAPNHKTSDEKTSNGNESAHRASSDEASNYRASGRTNDNVLVHFEAKNGTMPGDIVKVKVEKCRTFYVKGRVE